MFSFILVNGNSDYTCKIVILSQCLNSISHVDRAAFGLTGSLCTLGVWFSCLLQYIWKVLFGTMLFPWSWLLNSAHPLPQGFSCCSAFMLRGTAVVTKYHIMITCAVKRLRTVTRSHNAATKNVNMNFILDRSMEHMECIGNKQFTDEDQKWRLLGYIKPKHKMCYNWWMRALVVFILDSNVLTYCIFSEMRMHESANGQPCKLQTWYGNLKTVMNFTLSL